MEFLDGKRAHEAVGRALGHAFIVPDTGERINASTIDFTLIHRTDYEDQPVYRTRLGEGGVLLGHFVGSTREVAR
jgi:hypothetical protein